MRLCDCLSTPRPHIPLKTQLPELYRPPWRSFWRHPFINLRERACSADRLPAQSSFSKSSKSSSSQPPFLLCTVTFSASCCCSLTAFRMSFSCASLTLALSCPLFASMISRFSTSSARDALTRRILPKRSAASGSRICERMDCLASCSRFLCAVVSRPRLYFPTRRWWCSLLVLLLLLALLASTSTSTAFLLQLLQTRLAYRFQVRVGHGERVSRTSRGIGSNKERGPHSHAESQSGRGGTQIPSGHAIRISGPRESRSPNSSTVQCICSTDARPHFIPSIAASTACSLLARLLTSKADCISRLVSIIRGRRGKHRT